MNENDGGVTVPSVGDSSCLEGAGDEILVGNFGCEREKLVEEENFGGGDEGEVMVDVDGFVDGVGGGGGLEREVGGRCGDLGRKGGTGDGEEVGSGDLKLEEVVDHSSQVWDALAENGVESVDQGEQVVDEESLDNEEELSKDEMVDEESLDVGEELSKDEKDVEAKVLGTEIGFAAAEVNPGSTSIENQNLTQEVIVTKSVGVVDEGLVEEGERGNNCGDGETSLQDYVASGQASVFDDEASGPPVEAGDLCSSKMEESMTTHTKLVSEDVRDTVVVDENLATQAVDQSLTIELISEETDKGLMNSNVENLDAQVQVVEGEIDAMNEEGGVHVNHGVKETGAVTENLSSSVENQVLNVKTSDENLESQRVSGVSSLDTIEAFAGVEVVQVNDNNSSNLIDEAPNNVSLSLVGGVDGEVNTGRADERSFGDGDKVTTVPSVTIDTEISVSVSPSHLDDADKPLTIENKEVGFSVETVEDIEDQELKDDVDESSKLEVDPCTVPILSDDQNQYAPVSEVIDTGSKAINSIVEVPTTSDIGSFVSSSKEFESVTCEKETIENKDGPVLVDPEACIDGGDDAGMDIDEVMNWKDDVQGNNAFSDTLSDLEEDNNTDLRLNVEIVVGSSENDVARTDFKSSDDLIHNVEGSDVALMDLESTKFEVQEESNGIDSDCEDMELDSCKGDLSLSEFGENATTSTQSTEIINTSTGQEDLGISVENVVVGKGEITVMDDKVGFNSESVSMQEEKQEIVLQQAEIHIHEVYHGQGTDLPNTDEIVNEEASVVVQRYGVAEDDGGNMENTVNLHVLESQDGTEGGDLNGIDSNLGDGVEVEEGYPEGEQEQETQVQTTETENLISISKGSGELSDTVSSPPGHQSLYFHPPENEGDFSVSDLVWGKVRSHPWWPGQIFDPSDASEKALKYHKKDCFLVAYFGDRTFAWNDATDLKPFRSHFSQVQKHGNSETFRHAVTCALEEVGRREELGLACSCIPQDDYDKIKYQVVENTGIKQELSGRYGVDKSASLISFEPEKLLDYVKRLAMSPYDGTDQLEVVIAKAQLSSFSRFKGYPPLPEFQFSGELLESDDTLELVEEIEHPGEDEEVLVDNKRKRSGTDPVYPNKKEKNLSDLMVDNTQSSSDGEDGVDEKSTSKSVSTGGKKRRAIDSFPKPSFKIGECIRRAASQLTGSPSILKGSSEKFLKIDGDEDQFEVSVQTPGTSPRGRTNISTDQSSVYEMLSQLHLAAQDPMKGYSFLSTIIPFFSSYRTSVVSKAKRQSSSTGRPVNARKRKASNDASNTPEEYEFDDVSDSYWTDRIIQNYSEEQLLHDGQNGGGENHQQVVLEPKKQAKSGRKTNSRKRYSISKYEAQAEEPVEQVDRRKLDLPTELILNFAVGVSVPPEMNLNKTFRRFGPLMESETEVDRQGSRARVVFKKCSDAEVAYSSAGKFNIFGSKVVNYELNYSPVVSYKPLPLPTLEGPEGAM